MSHYNGRDEFVRQHGDIALCVDGRVAVRSANILIIYTGIP